MPPMEQPLTIESIFRTMEADLGPWAEEALEVADLSRSCRRDSYCTPCARAFCSHCCGRHHVTGFHDVIRIPLDAATGRPVIPTHYDEPAGLAEEPITIPDFIADPMAAADYTTPLAVDAYCLDCTAAFCSSSCGHHRRGGCATLRVEERGGRHYVRCGGDEGWFADLERILGDPVDGGDGETMLVPLLRRNPPFSCLQCGGPVPHPVWFRCSPSCAERHKQELARRRQRRDAMRAARQMAKLQIDGSY
ncbi:unnamed protein product [Urochloa humidicola]